MFRRKKKEEPTDAPAPAESSAAEEEPSVETAATDSTPAAMKAETAAENDASAADEATASSGEAAKGTASKGRRGNRVQKVGTVSSDKMQKTVVVRVDRLILHPKYRRYVRRTSKFLAHDEMGATTGDRVRIVETRPLSAKKRWRVVEIVQKAAK
jgi:small subunit ribosomal protein S17